MADPVRRATLLPPIGTPRERAIGGANAAAGEIDNDIIRRAGSPDIAEVPAEYLAPRAEARSVDVWDGLWPDDVKRAAIVAAPIVHRHKGTVLAVKAALSALKIDATVKEWWQEVPRGAPYTFSVTAYARARLYDGPVLDARLIRMAFLSVLRAKPESRAFDLTVVATMPATLTVAPLALAVTKCSVGFHPLNREAFGAGLGLAPVALAVTRCSVGLHPLNRESFGGRLGLAPVAVASTRVRVQMIASP